MVGLKGEFESLSSAREETESRWSFAVKVPGTLNRLLKSECLDEPRSVLSAAVRRMMHPFVSAGHLAVLKCVPPMIKGGS